MKKTIIIVVLFIFSCAGKLLAQEKDSVVILSTISVRAGIVVSEEVNKVSGRLSPNQKNWNGTT
jgi:uncharacterized membrane protein